LSETRREMLAVLEEFLPSLEELECVEMIGLMGSMTMPKLEPKDIDLVVCTASGSDLVGLAAIFRKMLGRLQSIGRGIDIFIFENGDYIGRPCIHRECAPGIRLSCKADHCGKRRHLCDDLKEMMLYPTTLTRLPVKLHPRSWYLDDVPQDIKDFVKQHKEEFSTKTISMNADRKCCKVIALNQ
jgi:hypothetical protein